MFICGGATSGSALICTRYASGGPVDVGCTGGVFWPNPNREFQVEPDRRSHQGGVQDDTIPVTTVISSGHRKGQCRKKTGTLRIIPKFCSVIY